MPRFRPPLRRDPSRNPGPAPRPLSSTRVSPQEAGLGAGCRSQPDAGLSRMLVSTGAGPGRMPPPTRLSRTHAPTLHRRADPREPPETGVPHRDRCPRHGSRRKRQVSAQEAGLIRMLASAGAGLSRCRSRQDATPPTRLLYAGAPTPEPPETRVPQRDRCPQHGSRRKGPISAQKAGLIRMLVTAGCWCRRAQGSAGCHSTDTPALRRRAEPRSLPKPGFRTETAVLNKGLDARSRSRRKRPVSSGCWSQQDAGHSRMLVSTGARLGRTPAPTHLPCSDAPTRTRHVGATAARRHPEPPETGLTRRSRPHPRGRS